MKTPPSISKKALWRIPLTAVLLGYAILGIIALCGVNIPDFRSAAYLHSVEITLTRWLDPLFLGVLAFYTLAGLYLTRESEQHQRSFLANIGPNAIFSIIFTAILTIFMAFIMMTSKQESIPLGMTFTFLVTCGIYMLVGGFKPLFDRYLYGKRSWKEFSTIIISNREFLDRLENKSAIIGFALGSGLVIGLFPTTLIVTGYLLLVGLITLFYNLYRFAAAGVKEGRQKLQMSEAYWNLKKAIAHWTGIGEDDWNHLKK